MLLTVNPNYEGAVNCTVKRQVGDPVFKMDAETTARMDLADTFMQIFFVLHTPQQAVPRCWPTTGRRQQISAWVLRICCAAKTA